MKRSIKIGVFFGITSGIITTLGLMVGLSSGTASKAVVIGGILTIAVADAFSDALGIHISEESDAKTTSKEVWESTFATFFAKFLFGLTFIVPVMLFNLGLAVIVSIIWGLSVLTLLTYFISRDQKESPWKPISEHVFIALVVIFSTHFLGGWISSVFSDIY